MLPASEGPRSGLPIPSFRQPIKTASPLEKESRFSQGRGGRDGREQSPVAPLCSRGGTHGVCGEGSRLERRDKLFLRGTRSEPRGAVAAGPAGSPRAGVQPACGGRPRAPQKDTFAAKGSYTPAGFLFVPSPKCAQGARETRKMHVPGGAPRAASRARRCREGPQKPLPARPVAPRPVPPSLPGSEPRESTAGSARSFLSGRHVHLSAPRPAPPTRARECRGSPRPADPEGSSEARERRVPALGCGLAAGPGAGASSSARLPPSHALAEPRRRTRSPREDKAAAAATVRAGAPGREGC